MPARHTCLRALWLAALLAAAAAVLPAGAGAATAGPDDDPGRPWPSDATIYNSTNESYPYKFTIRLSDHSPGASGVTYRVFSIAKDNLPQAPKAESFEELDTIVVYSDAGGFSGCTLFDVTAFGVDRNNDSAGTTVDEDWTDNTENVQFREEDITIEFAPKESANGPAKVGIGDQIVSRVSSCYQNPEEPGWYTWVGFMNGTTDRGNHASGYARSYPFYICNCSSRAEAREKLGPPPGSDTQASPTPTRTATPTATATPTPSPTPTPTATPTPSPTPTPVRTATERSPDPTAADRDTATATPAATATASTQGSADGARPVSANEVVTPTVADGAGFTSGLALLALVGRVLLLARRGG